MLFPRNGSCAACGRVLLHEEFICAKCDGRRKKTEIFCTKCGRAVEKDGVCISCETLSEKWDMAVSPYIYAEPTDEMIWQMKYRNRPSLADDLGKELGEYIISRFPDGEFDFITFIPSGSERLMERGYNQAQLLAEAVGNVMNVPVCEILHSKDSGHQVGLGAKERYENAVGRFSIDENADVKEKRIIIIDDVMTTGATMAAASSVLKRSGADYILAATVAQTESFVEN